MEYKNVELMRDTFVEINLDHLAHNLKNIKKRVGDSVAIAAVVKANAYGHGAVGVAKTLMENGAQCLAVATLTEAIELRKAYDEYIIFVMGYTPNSMLEHAVVNRIALTIFSLEQAELLNEIGERTGIIPEVHIKYDTGFNRLGYRCSDESIDEIKQLIKLPNIAVLGIFSHFALAGVDADQTQYDKLMYAISRIEETGFKFKYKHICDSIAAIDYPEYKLDMIRPGAIVYGMKSFRKNDIDLKPVMRFITKVYHIKNVHKGEGISYNYKWRAERDSVIATIPVGYSDGYPRNMTGVAYVTIGGKRADIVGVICMDQCMIDVTDIGNVKVGDEVVLFGDEMRDEISVHKLSEMAGTNKNEILVRITRRAPRVYVKDNRVLEVLDYLLKE